MSEPKLPDGLTATDAPSAAPHETVKAGAPGPERIGRFEVRRVLGEGAFARVYLGFDPDLEREVAIKVPHVAELTPEFRDAFVRENRLAAIIHHPNVCPVYEVGTDGARPYIVMRVVPNTLAGLLKRLASPMPPRHAVAIARKLALGLAAAHAQKVIHRDLKPANVLYDETNREVLLADFGLARLVDKATEASNGVPKGTPVYMAPEQARGRNDLIGPLSDVYSLGVILYELLTGHVPFTGSVWEVMRDHCETLPRLPSLARPGLDPRLDAICMKVLAKSPSDRYPSAKDFATALADYLRGSDSAVDVEALPIAEELPTRPARPTEALELPYDTTPSLPRVPVRDARRASPPPLPASARSAKKSAPVPPPLPNRAEARRSAPGTPLGTKVFFAGFGLLLVCGAALGISLSLGLWSNAPEEHAGAPNSTAPDEQAKAPVPAPGPVVPPAEPAPKEPVPGPKTDGPPRGTEPPGTEPLPPRFKDPPKVELPPEIKVPPKTEDPEKPEKPAKPVGPKPGVSDAERRAQAEIDYQTGRLYYTGGKGVAQDFAKAREWYQKAAEAGHANAQNDLGTLFHKGEGGARDYVKAREWYERAAAQGNANAQNNLGIIYEFGLGVTKDLDTALEWYEKGAKNGNTSAKAALVRLSKLK